MRGRINGKCGRDVDEERHGGILEMQSAANRVDGGGWQNSEANLSGHIVTTMETKRVDGTPGCTAERRGCRMSQLENVATVAVLAWIALTSYRKLSRRLRGNR